MTVRDRHPEDELVQSRLWTLHVEPEEERSRPSPERPTGASDDSLDPWAGLAFGLVGTVGVVLWQLREGRRG